jgi:hypothetical protein
VFHVNSNSIQKNYRARRGQSKFTLTPRIAQALADKYLNPEAVESADLLSRASVEALFKQQDDPNTTDAARNTMDTVINHMLGVQVPHKQFAATDVPEQTLARIKGLGRSHQDAVTSA